ncbi:hypothetical protein TNCV_4719711 [Trichonephila clavipes]|uniref:Uncharacterized protein n=1 Tax=Trichonephila clavipes TaxID=2585209 RepID=A0A8X6W5T7_TRICX|nr:hypothetical protein TNCV_4719711 [Trichonephila clavipes]
MPVLSRSFEHNADSGSLVANVSVRGWLVTSLSPVPVKTHRVWERCALNLSGAQTSSRLCGAVVWRKGCQLRFHSPWFQITVAKSPRVAEQSDVNIHSLTPFTSSKLRGGLMLNGY